MEGVGPVFDDDVDGCEFEGDQSELRDNELGSGTDTYHRLVEPSRQMDIVEPEDDDEVFRFEGR